MYFYKLFSLAFAVAGYVELYCFDILGPPNGIIAPKTQLENSGTDNNKVVKQYIEILCFHGKNGLIPD